MCACVYIYIYQGNGEGDCYGFIYVCGKGWVSQLHLKTFTHMHKYTRSKRTNLFLLSRYETAFKFLGQVLEDHLSIEWRVVMFTNWGLVDCVSWFTCFPDAFCMPVIVCLPVLFSVSCFVCTGVFLQGMVQGWRCGCEQGRHNRLHVGDQGRITQLLLSSLSQKCQGFYCGLVTFQCDLLVNSEYVQMYECDWLEINVNKCSHAWFIGACLLWTLVWQADVSILTNT